jgi:homogentisate 1,2-dioxygenase
MEITLLSRVIYQIDFDTAVNRLLYVESFAIYTPKRYKNESGQHLEHAPFCERDFILPTELETHDEKGDFLIKIKKKEDDEVVYASHPLM